MKTRYCVRKGAPRNKRHAYEVRVTAMEICAAGGGFVSKLSVEEFDDKFEEVDEAELEDSLWEERLFSVEGDAAVAITGYTDGRRWNGWAVPHVTFEELADLAPRWREYYDVENSEACDQLSWWEVDEVKRQVVLVEKYDGELHIHLEEPREHIIDGKKVELYDVSNGFCWEEGISDPREGN